MTIEGADRLQKSEDEEVCREIVSPRNVESYPQKSHQHGHLSMDQNKDTTSEYANTQRVRPELLTANYRQLWNSKSGERNSLPQRQGSSIVISGY